MPATDGESGARPRCHQCLGSIKPTLAYVRCKCGKTYHRTCLERSGECPNCGRAAGEAEQMEPWGRAGGVMKPGEGSRASKIKVHIVAAEDALERKEYATARGEVLQAMEESAEVQEKIAADELSSAQFKINYARNIGADVSSAERLLRDAKAALDANDYERTLELARKCRDETERAKERYKELVDLIYEAESLISEAHTVGKDTSEAERLLSKAVSLKSKNGADALAEAAKALAAMFKVLGRELSEIEIPLEKAAPHSALVPGQEEAIRKIFKILRENLLTVSDARSRGINPVRSARLLREAAIRAKEVQDKGSGDVGGVMDLLRQSRAALDEDIELSNPVLQPELRAKGLFSRSLRYGEWNNALLVLQNTGETAALEIGVKLSGDVELESLPPINKVSPHEKKELKVRLRPRQMGEPIVDIQVSFKRAYDGKTLETKHPVKLAVK
jgi:hypothetical protein